MRVHMPMRACACACSGACACAGAGACACADMMCICDIWCNTVLFILQLPLSKPDNVTEALKTKEEKLEEEKEEVLVMAGR